MLVDEHVYLIGLDYTSPKVAIVIRATLYIAEALLLFLFVSSYASFGGTNLSLIPRGNKRFEIHMAAKASIFPSIPSRLPRSFMEDGAAKILDAAEKSNFGGFIVLYSHLLSSKQKRDAYVQAILNTYPQWSAYECENLGYMSKGNAMGLNRLITARNKMDGKDRSPIVSGPLHGIIICTLLKPAISTT